MEVDDFLVAEALAEVSVASAVFWVDLDFAVEVESEGVCAAFFFALDFVELESV